MPMKSRPAWWTCQPDGRCCNDKKSSSEIFFTEFSSRTKILDQVKHFFFSAVVVSKYLIGGWWRSHWNKLSLGGTIAASLSPTRSSRVPNSGVRLFFNIRSTATIAASRHNAIRSAPQYPGVSLANWRKHSDGSKAVRAQRMFRIAWRDFSSGIPKEISRSNRPARRRLGSTAWRREVAPITRMWLKEDGAPVSGSWTDSMKQNIRFCDNGKGLGFHFSKNYVYVKIWVKNRE